MIITHKICMDLARRMLQPPIQVMQNDEYSRELEFLLTANGEPWDIPEGFAAMIRWHREPDKIGGNYDTLPGGGLAYSKRGNVLTVMLVPQICASPGQVYLTVMLASDSAVAHTFSVVINVCKNPGAQESVPAPEPDAYQQLLNEYSMMSARVNNLASLKEGSTTGDAELIDGRMDHTGHVHENIGSHIREKTSELEKNTVSCNPQAWTREQQAQARENLGLDALMDGTGSPCIKANETDGVVLEAEYHESGPELALRGSVGDEAVRLSNIATPVRNMDTANKEYVDFATGSDPDIHAKYFTITDDGVVSLKPEYRGACPSDISTFTFAISDNGLGVAGSRNAELPKHLVIPELVNEIAVVSLAPGMFMRNNAVENLALPDCITEIPDRFCDFAINLKNLYNTEQIEKIGMVAFQSVSLEKIKFPNLTSIGIAAFNNCPFLKYADIGNVTTIPNSALAGTSMLSRIKGGANVTTIEQNALRSTKRLNKVDFPSNIATVGKNAFFFSGLDCSWANLNTTDIWSGCNVTAKENPLPTLLSQYDPQWANETIGSTTHPYREGCILFSVIHAYCALHNLTISTVYEFEEIINQKDPTALNVFNDGGQFSDVPTLCTALGLNCTTYKNYGQTELQAVYNAIAQGKYVFISVPAATGASVGHAVLAYGVKENGDFMVADSALGAAEYVGRGDIAIKYNIPYQNITKPTGYAHIISL